MRSPPALAPAASSGGDLSRFVGIVCVSALLAGLLSSIQLGSPSLTIACSCAPRGAVAEVAGDPGVLVLTGTVAAIELANGPFGPQRAAQLTVLRVFQGQVRPGPVPIKGGDGANCLPALETGWHVVLTARIVANGLEPVACGHFGLLTTPEGQALLREVEAAFGQGAGPPRPTSERDVDLASVALIAVGGLVVAVLLGAVILAFGRRDRAAG